MKNILEHFNWCWNEKRTIRRGAVQMKTKLKLEIQLQNEFNKHVRVSNFDERDELVFVDSRMKNAKIKIRLGRIVFVNLLTSMYF